MEKELNVREWLDKETEGYFQLYSDCKNEDANYNDFITVFERYLEKYANYKNRILEDRIKEFRQLMAKSWFEDGTDYPTGIWIAEYDKHFNIQTIKE